MIKRILVYTICFSISVSPVLALESFGEYDFSDEAQDRFNQTENVYTPYFNVEDTSQPINIEQKYKKQKKSKKDMESDLTEVNLDIPTNPQQIIQVQKYDPKQTLQGGVVYIPQGEIIDIQLQSSISSGSLDENDRLTAVLPSNWIYNGNLIAPAGSLVYGTATDTTAAGYAYGSGSMELSFDKIVTPDGQTYNINAEKIRFENKTERGKKVTRDVLIGAGVGLLTGLLITAIGGNCYGCGGRDRNYGSAMLIYGAAGAAGGGIKGVASRGSDVFVDIDTVLKLKLIQPLEVVPQNTGTQLPVSQDYGKIY